MGDIQYAVFAEAFGALLFFILAITILLCVSTAIELLFWPSG